MFGYNPYGGYSSNPYVYARSAPSYSPDQEYLRALADERAAREQYLAARRAQEEARERAARARLARQAYAPHNSYHFDDDYDTYEDHDAYDGGIGAYPYGGYGATPAARQRRAMEELRRRDQLERERERMRLEEERRKLEEERRRMEEERVRRLLAEEQRQREEEDLRRRRASQFDPFLRSFGWTPEEDEMGARMGRTPLRTQAFAPDNRRQVPSKSPRTQQYPRTYLSPTAGTSRSSSMPARGVAQPPSLVSSKAGTSPRQTIPIRTPSPKTKAAPTLHRTPSPRPSEYSQQEERAQPNIDATPEQHDAARKIQEIYRAHAARIKALRTITDLRARFDRLRGDFRFPAALDFVLPGGGHVTVPADASVLERAAQRPEDVAADLNVHGSLQPARPELAYTSANAPLHGYLEELSRLLSALDAVESHGETKIREKRKALAREVEGEAERVERCVKATWGTWHETSESAPVVPENQVHEQEVASQPASESQSESNGGRPGPAEDAYMDVPVTVTVDAPQPQDVKDPPAAAQPVEAQAQDDNFRMDEGPDDQEQEPEMTIEVIEAEPEEQEGEKIEVDAPGDASEEAMQVESTEPTATAEPESPPTPEVDIEEAVPSEDVAGPSEAQMSLAVRTSTVEEAPPTPEVEITDGPEDTGAQDEQSVVEPMVAASAPVPAEEVHSAPTPEIDIQEESDGPASIADDKPIQNSDSAEDGIHEPEGNEESAPPASPQSGDVHLHPALSGFVEPVYATSPPPASLDDRQVTEHSTGWSPTKTQSSAPYVVEEPDGDERREYTMTPTLSPTKFDGESEGECDGPGTPPLEAHDADEVGMRSPVIVVTPADQDEDAVKSCQHARKIPREAEMTARRMDFALVDRDWREVQEFDMF